MRATVTAIVVSVALGLVPASAKEPKTPSETIRFATGTTSATRSGRVVGYGAHDYLVDAAAGQTLSVKLATKSPYAYVSISEASGSVELEPAAYDVTEWTGVLPKTGTYRITVYIVRSEARRGGSAAYALTVAIPK